MEVIDASPGNSVHNTTGRTLYQLFCTLDRVCGACLQYHTRVGPYWPIPIHVNCRCTQEPIHPDGVSQPYADFEQILARMDSKNITAAVGKANYDLIKNRVVSFDDVVTPTRVRSLQEVVSRQKLDVAKLEKAGVSPGIAKQAHGAVNTPEHLHAARQRAAAIEQLRLAGATDHQISKALSQQIAQRVAIRHQDAAGIVGQKLQGKLVDPYQASVILHRQMREAAGIARIRYTGADAWLEITTKDGRIIRVKPGQTIEGRTYDQWAALI